MLVTDHSNGSYTSGLPEQLPPPPAAGCAVPTSGIDHYCTGELVSNESNVSDIGSCCALCTDTEGCQVWSHTSTNNTCLLHRSCAHHHSNVNWTTGWAPPATPERSSSYRVGRGSFDVSGYVCGPSNSSKTIVFYPKGPGPFGVVIYGHGEWGGIDGCDSWLESVASRGLVVIAPFAGENLTDGCGAHFVQDLLLALEASHASSVLGQVLHPSLSSVDWSSVGMFGHSRGAKYVIPAARLALSAGFNVSAVLASSDVPQHHYDDLDVPLMFTTGSKDMANTDNSILEYFSNVTTTPRIYASLQDAFHMEPQEGMRLNAYTASFLACHVVGRQEDCDFIYGSAANSLCEANTYETCQVELGIRNVLI